MLPINSCLLARNASLDSCTAIQNIGPKLGTAPFLPMPREEMDELGWDSCDIIMVTADACIDHPSWHGRRHRNRNSTRRS